MNKTLVAIAMLASTTSFAYADISGFYLNGQLGGSLNRASSINHSFIDGDIDPSNLSFDSQNKFSFSGGAGLGYNFKPQFNVPIRTELMFTMRGNLDKNTNSHHVQYEDENNPGNYLNDDYYLHIKTRMNTLMVNTYYDFDTGTNFTPYVSLGVGAAFLKYERTGLVSSGDNDNADINSKSKTRFAYAAGIGGNYKITDSWSADIVARYTYGGKISVSTDDNSSNSELKLSTTDLMVGVRYSF